MLMMLHTGGAKNLLAMHGMMSCHIMSFYDTLRDVMSYDILCRYTMPCHML